MYKTIAKYTLCLTCVIVAQASIVKGFKQHRSNALSFTAKYYDEQGRYDLSQANALDAYSLDKYNDLAMFYLANASYKQDNFAQAAQQFEQSVYLPHQTNRWRALGLSRFHESKFLDSAKAFSDYLTVVPNPTGSATSIFRLLATSLMKTEKYNEAAFYYNKSISGELSGDTVPVALQPALVNAIFDGRTDEARFYFDLLKSKYPGTKLNGPDFLVDANDKMKMKKIADFLTPIWDKEKSDASIAMILAASLNQADELTPAEKVLKEAKGLFPQDSDIAMIYADLLFRLKRPYDAKAEYQRHLTLRPDSPFKQQIQGRIATLQ